MVKKQKMFELDAVQRLASSTFKNLHSFLTFSKLKMALISLISLIAQNELSN